jgi:xylulose-5-phosphate/fructose-6-phosphate phosphoketolase
MSGPKFLDGAPIEGSYKSHQVPLASPATVPEQFDLLKQWLESYSPADIFSSEAGTLSKIDAYVVPSNSAKKMGQRKETYDAYHNIDLPDWKNLTKGKGSDASSTKLVGQFIRDVFKK